MWRSLRHPWTLSDLNDAESPYLLDFRHKKGRPWTPLDVYLVEPGGFESKDTVP